MGYFTRPCGHRRNCSNSRALQPALAFTWRPSAGPDLANPVEFADPRAGRGVRRLFSMAVDRGNRAGRFILHPGRTAILVHSALDKRDDANFIYGMPACVGGP